MAISPVYAHSSNQIAALKELYVDSALKKAEKLNANDEPKPEPKKPEKLVSYKQFKKFNK